MERSRCGGDVFFDDLRGRLHNPTSLAASEETASDKTIASSVQHPIRSLFINIQRRPKLSDDELLAKLHG